jgi:hypothetical protein
MPVRARTGNVLFANNMWCKMTAATFGNTRFINSKTTGFSPAKIEKTKTRQKVNKCKSLEGQK